MRNYPPSVSTYQYQSSAIRCRNIRDVFQHTKGITTFFSFLIGFPLLGIASFFIIVLSYRDDIEKSIKKPKEHKNFAALVCLGVTLAWFATGVDIFAVIVHQHVIATDELYYSIENSMNMQLYPFLITSIVLECIVIIIFDLAPLGAGCFLSIDTCLNSCYETISTLFDVIIDAPRFKAFFRPQWQQEQFWTFMLPLIPPIWCISSRFGFIIVAWTSFIRHSSAFTVFYIFAVTVMFIVMRQTYSLIVRSLYTFKHNLNTENERNDKMEEDGISIPAIWLVRLVGVVIVLVFAYLMFGLWLLPVSEVVEDAPVYLNDALQLVFVVLAALISYELFSIKDQNLLSRDPIQRNLSS